METVSLPSQEWLRARSAREASSALTKRTIARSGGRRCATSARAWMAARNPQKLP